MSSVPAKLVENGRGALQKGPEINHNEGVPTRRAEFREFARRIVDDETYQENLLQAMRDRKVSPAVERLILEAAYCSVKVDEQGGADEQLRGEAMRAAIEELVRSGKGAELDAKMMGARRVIPLPPHSVRRVPDGDESA